MVLPGDFYKGISSDEPDAFCCVDGCAAPVYGRRAGEVDSFGVEWDHFCEEHYHEALNKPDEPIIGDCEWCKATDVEVFPTRDTDEGFYGPVYDVCKGCRQRQIKRDMEDMELDDIEEEDDSELYDNLDQLRAELSEEEERERQEAEWREEAEQERAYQTKMADKFMGLVKRLANVNVTQEQLVKEIGDSLLTDETVIDTLKTSVLKLEAIALMQNAIDEIDQFVANNDATKSEGE